MITSRREGSPWQTPAEPVVEILQAANVHGTGRPRKKYAVVNIKRPRCPSCRSAELQTVHSDAEVRDGEVLRIIRRTKCKKCNQTFFVVAD